MVFSRTSDPGGDISPLLSTLTAVSRRWKNIEFPWLRHLDADSTLLSLTSEEVPLLETVKISQFDNSTIDCMFLATEGLRSLTLPAINNCHQTPVS